MPFHIYMLHLGQLPLDHDGDRECFFERGLDACFKPYFFLASGVHLFFQILGFPNLGQSLGKGDHLRGPPNIVIGLMQFTHFCL